jgi:hypothetical protein
MGKELSAFVKVLLLYSLSFSLSFGRFVSLVVTFSTPLALRTEKSPPLEKGSGRRGKEKPPSSVPEGRARAEN